MIKIIILAPPSGTHSPTPPPVWVCEQTRATRQANREGCSKPSSNSFHFSQNELDSLNQKTRFDHNDQQTYTRPASSHRLTYAKNDGSSIMIPLIVCFALLVSVAAFVPVTPIPPQLGKSSTNTNTSPYRRTRVSEVEHTGQQRHHHGFPSQLNYSKMKGSAATNRLITLAAKGTIPNPNESEIVAAEDAAELVKQERLRSSYGVLAILLFTFASNQWSRQALYYLCDFSANADPFKHINAGLGFDKENYAALASFGFTLIFAGVSLVAGGVADTYDRNRVTAASCAVWYVYEQT